MQIKKIDVIWNYFATFLKIAASAILLPIILRVLPSQDVGIWAIFSTISALIFLIDFGFNSSFSRNVTYVLSGVQSLQKEGFPSDHKGLAINYNLLKGLLKAMRWFYSRVSFILLLLLLTVGTYYINIILKNYEGDKSQIFIAWILFCLINTYNLYTLYYDALLEGMGLIKASKQITILGNLIYLLIGSLLVWKGFGLIALVLAQLLSVIVIRVLAYRMFFTKQMIEKLANIVEYPRKAVINAISPNAFKYGITSLGGFMIQKSSVFIGSMFIALSAIASFGITKQLFDIIIAVANITLVTYLPQITNLRIEGDNKRIKEIFLKGILISNIVYLIAGLSLIILGPIILSFIGSNTELVSLRVMMAMFISSFIGLNAGISGAVISTRNEIPFMKPSIYSGIATVILLIAIFKFTNLGLFGMALAPGVIDLCYQGWKWPLMVFRDLKITLEDVKIICGNVFSKNTKIIRK